MRSMVLLFVTVSLEGRLWYTTINNIHWHSNEHWNEPIHGRTTYQPDLTTFLRYPPSSVIHRERWAYWLSTFEKHMTKFHQSMNSRCLSVNCFVNYFIVFCNCQYGYISLASRTMVLWWRECVSPYLPRFWPRVENLQYYHDELSST